MRSFEGVRSLVPALVLAFASTACGAAASDFDDGASNGEDESWGEATSLGKADGAGMTAAHKALLAKFEDPALTDAEEQAVLNRYPDVDPHGDVPGDLLERALVYYDFNLELLDNDRYLTVIDFSQHSGKRRLYLIDMHDGSVERHVVAHGSGSDPDNDGVATKFSNVSNSHKSSLGFYLTAETYSGKWGLSLRLDGLSETNSAARPRAIVMHGASYVANGKSKQGRSWGCPAIPLSERNTVIPMLKEGSLMYAERSAE
jgi:hypothetical protein